MNRSLYITFSLILFSFGKVQAGDVNLDSLWSAWEDTSNTPENRFNALKSYTWKGYLFKNPDSAIYFSHILYDFCGDKDLKDRQAAAAMIAGIANDISGNYPMAIVEYDKSLKIYEKINDTLGIARVNGNIGLLYYQMENYDESLKYYFKSLSIVEELRDSLSIASVVNNIGASYQEMNQNDKALEFYSRGLKIAEQLKDQRRTAIALNNVGLMYQLSGASDSAIPYFERSIRIKDSIDDVIGMAESLNNLAAIYSNKKAHKMSVKYGIQALEMAKQAGFATGIRDGAEIMYRNYKALNQTSKALEMHELFMSMKDSIKNDENQEAIISQQYKHEYEKKALADSIHNAREKEVQDARLARKNAELKTKKNQQYALFGGIILVLIFSGFMYNRFKVTRQQNQIIEQKNDLLTQTNEEIAAQRDEIERQKDVVEEAHKEIKDSIDYARRIQTAILPTIGAMKRALPEVFVLYTPKDVVAGDFYWMEQWENKVYIAAADCTGHGVPGAMVSVICSNALKKTLLEEHVTGVGKILDRTRELVQVSFEKSEETIKDGMDISLACIDTEHKLLCWAGANNPLYLYASGEIEIVKGDKEPIGFTEEPTPFTEHQIKLQDAQMLYLFTDGYADQFGGPKGKKLGYRKFREKLLEIASLNLEEQQAKLESFFQEWKGKEEQVDDVCIVGVKV